MRKIKFIALIVAAAMALMPLTAMAGEKEEFIYTALGDSVAFGIGGEIVDDDPLNCYGYVDMLEDHFEKIYGDNVTVNDLSTPAGLTSEDLRGYLNLLILNHGITSEYRDVNYEFIYSKIHNADLITISAVGGELLDVVDEIDPERDIAAQLYLLGDELNAAVNDFYNNWTGADGYCGIYQLVRMINPDAEIYVSNLYNAFGWDETLKGLTADVHEAINFPIDNKIYYVNGELSMAPADFEVADIYSAFDDYGSKTNLLIHNTYSTDPDSAVLHPTTKGYKMIYNTFKDIME